MNASNGTDSSLVTSTGGISLHVQTTMPAGKPRAAAVLVHGFAEYSGRYTRVKDQLLAAGLAVNTFDLRGHGRSGGRRGHVTRSTDYLDDLEAVLSAWTKRGLDVPVFLLGHSLGGLIVLHYLMERPCSAVGVVVSSPFLGFALKVPGWKAFLGNVLSHLVPSFSMPNGIDAGLLSHEPSIVESYRTDPMVHHVASSRWFTEIKATQASVMGRAHQITSPILVLQAEDDRLVSLAATKEFFEHIGSSDKEIKLYPNLFHEIFNEPQGPEIIAEVVGWISHRIKSGATS